MSQFLRNCMSLDFLLIFWFDGLNILQFNPIAAAENMNMCSSKHKFVIFWGCCNILKDEYSLMSYKHREEEIAFLRFFWLSIRSNRDFSDLTLFIKNVHTNSNLHWNSHDAIESSWLVVWAWSMSQVLMGAFLSVLEQHRLFTEAVR